MVTHSKNKILLSRAYRSPENVAGLDVPVLPCATNIFRLRRVVTPMIAASDDE
jgi:hypothetical protein